MGTKVKYLAKSGHTLPFCRCETMIFCHSAPFPLPFVSLDIVSLDILEVVSEVILQSGHHAAVLVHQLSGARLCCEPVHHRGQLLLLNLLRTNTSHQADKLHSFTSEEWLTPSGKPAYWLSCDS